MNSIAQRYPLVSYYLLTLILSGVIFAILFAAGLVEELFFLGTFGPGLAAILVTFLISGGTGVRELLGRLLIWRVRIQWWLVALLLPALIVLGAVYLFSLFGGPAPDFSRYQPLYTVVPMIILMTVLNGGWGGVGLARFYAATHPISLYCSGLEPDRGVLLGNMARASLFRRGYGPVHLPGASRILGRLVALHRIYDCHLRDLNLGFQQHARQRFDRCFPA